MNDTTAMLVDTAERIFSEHCTPEVIHAAERGEWPQALWTVLDESGLAAAGVPEALDGGGLQLTDAVALLRVAGCHAIPLPLAEHWLAAQALAAAGATLPAPMLSLALNDAQGARASWGRKLPVVVLSGEGSDARLRVHPQPRIAREGANLAGEPLDTLDLAASKPSLDLALPGGTGVWRARGALLRSAQMAGAMRRCLDLSLTYASERQQFGRPLAGFQAIQQELALLAADVAAVEAAVEAAAHSAGCGRALDEIAAAKARASMAVEPVTRIAHQVHGAMGFTQEHRLHLFTRRLLAWRDDYGTEAEWNGHLGRRALAAGGAALWPYLTTLAAD